MIVVDASVIVAALLGAGNERDAIRARLAKANVHCPHLVDLEVAAALRRLVVRGRMRVDHAHEALSNLSRLDITRHAHNRYLPRIWELRDSITAYDAAYVALAERAEAPLLTIDQRLAQAHGPRCTIEVVEV